MTRKRSVGRTRAEGAKRQRKKAAPYKVFISHSSRDNWVAGVMAEKVETLGAETWLDVKSLKGGQIVAGEIIKAIKECDEAVVLISPASVKAPWVIFEIGAARARDKRITPILYHVEPKALAPLEDIKAMDLNDFGNFLADLAKRVAAR